MEGVLHSWSLRVQALEGLLNERNKKLCQQREKVSRLKSALLDHKTQLEAVTAQASSQRAKWASLGAEVGQSRLAGQRNLTRQCQEHEQTHETPTRWSSHRLHSMMSKEESAMTRFEGLQTQHYETKQQMIGDLLQRSTEDEKQLHTINAPKLQMQVNGLEKRLSLSRAHLANVAEQLLAVKAANTRLEQNLSSLKTFDGHPDECKLQENLTMVQKSLAALLQHQESSESRMYEARRVRDESRKKREVVEKDLLQTTTELGALWP